MIKGGFGGLIGNGLNWESSIDVKDLVSLGRSYDLGKGEFVNILYVFEILSWSKIFGKVVKFKVLIILIVVISNLIVLWGGIFVEIDIKWIEFYFISDGFINFKFSKLFILDFNFVVKLSGDIEFE